MDDTALEGLIDSGAALYGIEVLPEWRAAVRMHLAISLRHAAAVLDADIGDSVDPAPVYGA